MLAVLCCAMLCYAVLCCAILQYVEICSAHTHCSCSFRSISRCNIRLPGPTLPHHRTIILLCCIVFHSIYSIPTLPHHQTIILLCCIVLNSILFYFIVQESSLKKFTYALIDWSAMSFQLTSSASKR